MHIWMKPAIGGRGHELVLRSQASLVVVVIIVNNNVNKSLFPHVSSFRAPELSSHPKTRSYYPSNAASLSSPGAPAS